VAGDGWIHLADDGATHRVTVRIPKAAVRSVAAGNAAVQTASVPGMNGAAAGHAQPVQISAR
jgi:hypothetical protein